MVDPRGFIIRHSVEDVLGILEREPVRPDLVTGITAVQLLNRVSLAHLSIERALKFLITNAGGPLIENHALGVQYRELAKHDTVSAELLDQVFEAAVRHYRYNQNARNMTHLGTIERHLTTVGSDRAFQEIRYWELTQSDDEILLRVYLSIHIELLHGLSQMLLGPDRPVETVIDRVERAVQDAMWPAARMAYGEGTPQELSVRSYIQWRQGFDTWSEALAAGVDAQFDIGDAFMRDTVSSAYQVLLDASDPAIAYFANTLDILPMQQRNAIPHVEWLGAETERVGTVSTPAGTPLGRIERGPDGIWYITPLRDGLVRISAKSRTQTDARCYLAALLTRETRVRVGSDYRELRVVGTEHNLFNPNYEAVLSERERDNQAWTHKITFWDHDHGIEAGDRLRVEARSIEQSRICRVLEGTATEVAKHEVYVSGFDTLDVTRSEED